MTSSHPSNSEKSTAFDLLAEPVQRWIWRKGWDSLRDIQEHAIPQLLNSDEDLIIAASTAGGKTEAAFFPLISSVLNNPGSGGFDLVYIGPLRALINDQFKRLEDLCEGIELPVYPWHGEISQTVKSRARANPCGILLITPESLEALFVLRGNMIPTLFESTRAVVIDELHALLDNERGIHLRSLLNRLELAVNRRIRRIGLSATLGEMALAKEYLRPQESDGVALLESKSDGKELRVQIRGYLSHQDRQEDEKSSAFRSVVKHLFQNLRGKTNLIFAGSRQNVEIYADGLREISSKHRVPVEFFPHHASLSREHRIGIEERLKECRATTAICTSTLELGIDIGSIDCVAQIGAPFSVASLRQRLGRSGRRLGQPAVLRMYVIETEPNTDAHPLDRLHLNLIRSIAMVELLIEGWCEPPAPESLHLSTLTHQILSVIAERGGASASRIFTTLCRQGPFQKVDSHLFERLLRCLGRPDVGLIEQTSDGSLLLGSKGESLVEHYSFYAVFQTSQEYRIIADGKSLGTLPVTTLYRPDMTIIFSGRRWRITSIHDRDKVIEVTADRTGRPPVFGGGAEFIHDRIVEKMKEVLAGTDIPAYLGLDSEKLLKNARSEFIRLGLNQQSVYKISERSCLAATWAGTIKTSTLALILQTMGYTVSTYDGFLDISWGEDIQPVEVVFKEIAGQAKITSDMLRAHEGNLATEKFHSYLNRDLLLEDAISSRINLSALPQLASSFVDGG